MENSQDFNAADFSSAFGDLLSEGTSTESTSNENNEDEETAQEEQGGEVAQVGVGSSGGQPQDQAQGNDPIEALEANARAAREKWKLQKENKELKAEMERLRSEAKRSSVIDTDNPLKELGKMKGWSKDDIVNKALEAMEEDGMSPEEAEDKVKTLSTEEIIKKVREELKREAEEEKKKDQTNQTIDGFIKKIKEFSAANVERFPLISGLGQENSIFNAIEADYLKKEEEFGVEYAQKNMMTMEQAAKKINDELAQSIKTTLKSDHVRKFILAALKEEGQGQAEHNQLEDFFQLEDEAPKTLTNKSTRKVSDPRDPKELTDEESFKQAFAYLG